MELIQERELKIGRQIEQSDIAEFVGVSEQTIIDWIRNEATSFDVETIELMCDYFDCDLCDLLYSEMVDVDESEIRKLQ